jgi:hypothetical protein
MLKDSQSGNSLLTLQQTSLDLHAKPIIGVTASADLTSAVNLQQLKSNEASSLRMSAVT